MSHGRVWHLSLLCADWTSCFWSLHRNRRANGLCRMKLLTNSKKQSSSSFSRSRSLRRRWLLRRKLPRSLRLRKRINSRPGYLLATYREWLTISRSPFPTSTFVSKTTEPGPKCASVSPCKSSNWEPFSENPRKKSPHPRALIKMKRLTRIPFRKIKQKTSSLIERPKEIEASLSRESSRSKASRSTWTQATPPSCLQRSSRKQMSKENCWTSSRCST